MMSAHETLRKFLGWCTTCPLGSISFLPHDFFLDIGGDGAGGPSVSGAFFVSRLGRAGPGSG